MTSDSIVLLSKKPGITSFSSLRNVKKALGTNKVGHTGTLDSFAEGLLVVCTGHYTKLCGQITAFDKTYEAVIHFGKETDTCEYTGNLIKEAEMPSEEDLRKAVQEWTGDIMQKPPLFSALHVDGKRASDLVREGKIFELPARPVKIFSSTIKELKYSGDRIEYARIEFSVSKGTYIRSLARDIAESAKSAAYLTGLFRKTVGNFRIEDAAGFDLLEDFNIENSIKKERDYLSRKSSINGSIQDSSNNSSKESNSFSKNDDAQIQEKIQKEILEKKQDVTPELAELCGFKSIYLKDQESYENFKNGKPLKSYMFEESLWDFPEDSTIAVFLKPQELSEKFCGLINKNSEGKISYGFVIN